MRNKIKIKDTVGTIYQYFLKLMVLLQLSFIYYEYKADSYFFIGLHFLVCLYFIFRLYVFIQMKGTAHKSGKTLLEYLEDIKKCR